MTDVNNRRDSLLKESKGVQEKESVMGVRGRYPSLAITVWHPSASLVIPDSDLLDGFFLSAPHTSDRSFYSFEVNTINIFISRN